eukprot:CAMPEP_0172683416 /NCGR_PEP_ID=MMETSP1074-20121228/18833_1 /TAXON_ID=2916 /ORGANISM="Ceratium fusus, Strain PA161109" /LENGTH=71 /DNA_ID=CAMNT_0013502257 /DNA_START=407 /DNA_END=622 /DNA_ORIENTATION=+
MTAFTIPPVLPVTIPFGRCTTVANPTTEAGTAALTKMVMIRTDFGILPEFDATSETGSVKSSESGPVIAVH